MKCFTVGNGGHITPRIFVSPRPFPNLAVGETLPGSRLGRLPLDPKTFSTETRTINAASLVRNSEGKFELNTDDGADSEQALVLIDIGPGRLTRQLPQMPVWTSGMRDAEGRKWKPLGPETETIVSGTRSHGFPRLCGVQTIAVVRLRPGASVRVPNCEAEEDDRTVVIHWDGTELAVFTEAGWLTRDTRQVVARA